METPIQKLIKHFGSQRKTAEALGVKQGTVSGWATGRHGVSEVHALVAEKLTDGNIKAVDLCPRLNAIAA
tara:strand:+ start:3785 stop:3994 length:210 start_codon:yes stop_codon:yes gene_type:complete